MSWVQPPHTLGAVPEALVVSALRQCLGRELAQRRMRAQRGSLPWDPARPAVLVVSHEASTTGAPILSLNLGQALAERHTVVHLVLAGPGPLSPALAEHSHWLLHSGGPLLLPGAWQRALRLLPRQLRFRYALVNSVVAFSALEPLRRHGIAGLCLVHEFAAYVRPPLAPTQAYLEAGLWAHRLIFSAAITWQDARRHWPQLAHLPVRLLPQGQSQPPRQSATAAADLPTALAHLQPRLRPHTQLVLGAGAVQPRKGVDLFIAMAHELERRAPNPDRFYLWLGGGYRPDTDLQVSVWLHDQIERSGLSNQLQILEAHDAYAWLIQRCDLFVLSSRLDPLPNVAIDALRAAKPLLAFERASGIAELLASDPLLARHALAPYLDPAAMACQAERILAAPALAAALASCSQALAQRHFQMDDYVAALEVLGEEAHQTLQREQAELEALITLPEPIDRPFQGLPRRWSQRHLLHHHLRQWRSRVLPRKPRPGFHPGIYAERMMAPGQQQDPLLHWLQQGQPAGPWQLEVISPQEMEPQPAPSRTPATPTAPMAVGLHLHVHYPELLPPLLRALRHNQLRPKLVVTLTDTSQEQAVGQLLERGGWELLALRCLPNRGRDLGPFLSEAGPLLEQHCQIYGHLHTKATPAAQRPVVERWRRFLLDQLLGTAKRPMADAIVQRMAADPSIGLVFPDDPACIGWDGNRAEAERLATRLQLEPLPEQIRVPVGSMFWVRRGALARLYELGWSEQAYPPEPLPHDGSVLHAIERLLPLVVEQAGYRCAVCHQPGLSR